LKRGRAIIGLLLECSRRIGLDLVIKFPDLDRASLIVVSHAGILSASKHAFGNLLSSAESIEWKRMRSGDRPGLQNRRVAGNPVTGGFDPHSLPPFFNDLRRGAIRSHSVERQPGHFRSRCVHLIGDNPAVDIHGGANVAMPHQLLLDRDSSSYCVEPTAITVTHRMGTQPADA
jgi:hypothetical protein